MEDTPLPDFFDSQAKPADTAAPEAPKKKRGPKPGTKRKARAERPRPVEAVAPVEAPKKRNSKTPRKAKAPRTAKVELSLAFHALTGLNVDEAKIMASISAGLQQVPKKSRARVVAALGKLFQ
jgi:hypothetical protein